MFVDGGNGFLVVICAVWGRVGGGGGGEEGGGGGIGVSRLEIRNHWWGWVDMFCLRGRGGDEGGEGEIGENRLKKSLVGLGR